MAWRVSRRDEALVANVHDIVAEVLPILLKVGVSGAEGTSITFTLNDVEQLFVSSVSVTAPPEPDEQSRVLAEFPESALITTL